MSEQASRRQFLVTSACASAGVCAGMAMGCGGEGQGGGGGTTPNEPIGDPNFYPASPRQPMAPMDNSMPMCPSTTGLIAGPQSKTLGVNQRTPSLYGGTYVICRSSDGLYALDLRCPHAGCQPALQSGSQYWVCPCHGSTFEIDGTFVLGPALRSLKRFYVCEGSDGNLYIDTNKPI